MPPCQHFDVNNRKSDAHLYLILSEVPQKGVLYQESAISSSSLYNSNPDISKKKIPIDSYPTNIISDGINRSPLNPIGILSPCPTPMPNIGQTFNFSTTQALEGLSGVFAENPVLPLRQSKLPAIYLNRMEQRGVLRTNCIDCLDRTNVAQLCAGMGAMGQMLYVMGIIDSPTFDCGSRIVLLLTKMYSVRDYITRKY